MGIDICAALTDVIGEYINKVEFCDECVCEYYCISNGLKDGRKPKDCCKINMLHYIAEKHQIVDVEQ